MLQGAAELAAFLEPRTRLVERGIRYAHRLRGDAQPPAVQRFHGDAEPVAGPADETVGGDAEVAQKEFAGLGAADAHLALRGGDEQAGVVTAHHEGAQAFRALPAGTGKEDIDIGPAGIGDEYLVSVDDVETAVQLRRGGDGPHVRPGLGLREREGPQLVAAEHGTKEAFLLHGRAEGMERMAGKAHVRRIGDAHGRAGLGKAFHTADIRFIAGAAPAQLGRIGKPHESGVGQGSDRLPAEKAFLITALGHRPHGPRNDLIKALPERCFHSVHPPRGAQRNPISGGD